MKDYLKLGSWNVICDICGFKFKADELKKDWRGLMVCEKDFELRNPQDFIRLPPEQVAPPWTRPYPPDSFINVCDLWKSSPMAGFGSVGCLTIGGNTNIPLVISIFNPTCIVGRAIASRSIVGVS